MYGNNRVSVTFEFDLFFLLLSQFNLTGRDQKCSSNEDANVIRFQTLIETIVDDF